MTMKLYTEEQVRKLLYHTRSTYSMLIMTENDVFSMVTPIELPNRDMADKASLFKSQSNRIDFLNGWIWTLDYISNQIKEQILNQNK